MDKLRAARAEYHEKAHTLTAPEIAKETEKFKTLNQTVIDLITEGARDCGNCLVTMEKLAKDAEKQSKETGIKVEPATWSPKPHGIFHDGTANPFEIGCLRCPNHRIREALPEDAVEKWNAADHSKEGVDGGFLPKRETGTVMATHRDLTGNVKSEKMVKVRPVH